MTGDPFDDALVGHVRNRAAATHAGYPQGLESILSRSDGDRALAIISRWQGYQPTPLHDLHGLAVETGVGAIFYKDEGGRFGLGSFKALGGCYAVMLLLERELAARHGLSSPGLDDLGAGKCVELTRDITVVTATDGNHGRSVAWGAAGCGCSCYIYVHADVSPGRVKFMEDQGATVIRVDGTYDDSVRQAAEDAAARGWLVVSDTSYEGYMKIPGDIMAGYTVLASELLHQMPEAPTHVFIQGGAGGLAAAVLARFWQGLKGPLPRFIVVEPERAACLFESARNGRPTGVKVTEDSIMAGLSCGEISPLAWPILAAGASDFLTIPDAVIPPAMKMLADGPGGDTGGDRPVVAGETGVAGLAGLIAVMRHGDLARTLGLDGASRVLLIGSEGATDPEVYASLVGRRPEEI